MLDQLLANSETLLYSIFGIVITVFLILDLGVFHKKAAKITQKDALQQSIFWVFISIVFGGLIYFYYESPVPGMTQYDSMLEFYSAYLTEKALSVDNIFVILLILRYFKVKDEYYHGILFWGILGAVIFRAVFIFLGALLISKAYWILYIFGAFLIYSGLKIFKDDEDMEIEPEKNPLIQFSRKFLPISKGDFGGRFVLIKNKKLIFTPLFLVIVLIESTDLIFAVDSIPAAFAITQNPFIIYTSNIFAVMGLRAMFFLLSNILDKFYLLQKGLSLILIFIGAKMLVDIFDIHVPIILSFSMIIVLLAGSIILSLIFPKKPTLVNH